MAVYKPTLCYPFLNGVDLRVAKYDWSSTASSEKPVQYLSCKVDTSNKNITGYKIKILSDTGIQIFPTPGSIERISPISELQVVDGYEENGLNSGVNGSMLKIPFFQNMDNKLSSSFNALYFVPKALVDHVIMKDGSFPSVTLTAMENVDNWSMNPEDNTLYYTWPYPSSEEQKRKNIIILDGEEILEGEKIFIYDYDIVYDTNGNGNESLSNKSGIWKATKIEEDSPIRFTTILEKEPSGSLFGDGDQVVVLRGERFHNSCWEYTSNGGYIPEGAQWEDISGNPENFLSLSSATISYRWAITLYQGDSPVENEEYGAKYIEYPEVDPRFLDMTVMSGKILGSTPERIQIGKITDDYMTSVVPEGTTADPLVLQEYFMELSEDEPTGILSGGDPRVYVKNYDSTYGHVYPISQTLNTADINNANFCQFFKHSNEESAIEDTDIVDYCFTSNLSFTYWGAEASTLSSSKKVWKEYLNEEDLEAGTSVTERYLVVGELSGVSDQDLILLTKQDYSYQNGVYTYFPISKYTESDGVFTSETKYCLKRAASYESWANYLGKIIFTINGDGDSGGRVNWESLAQSGTYTLWNINSTTSGTSKLFFVKERPLLLFANELEQNCTFDLFDVTNVCPDPGSEFENLVVDGITVSVGDKIIYKDGKFGTVESVTTTGYTLSSSFGSGEISEEGTYFYILYGETLSKLVFKWDSAVAGTGGDGWSAGSANWDLFSARVLKNTPTVTFISPWSYMREGMDILLLGGKKVYYDYQSESEVHSSPWIKIESYNNGLFCVGHKALSIESSLAHNSPLESYSSTDDSVPWSYDLRTFFFNSDENPFYSYETPYLILYKDGYAYSELSLISFPRKFYVNAGISSEVPFFVTGNGTEKVQFTVSPLFAQAQIVGRMVEFKADYVQFGQSSWQSYRWVLYDADWKVVQDTGKKYDHEIKTIFYGLANDTSKEVTYNIVLFVENDFGEVAEAAVSLSVVSGESSQSFLPSDNVFSAVFDCSTQSVILGFSKDAPYLYSIYRREYDIYRTEQDILSTKDTEDYSKFRSYKGEWSPVLVQSNKGIFRDFNVSNGRSYQYIVYSGEAGGFVEDRAVQTFANWNGEIWVTNPDDSSEGRVENGSYETSPFNGASVTTNWGCWSLAELIPEDLSVDTPALRKIYQVNNDNIWLFKYSLETGEETQNIAREEFQTLGKYPKVGFGETNAISGSVTAQLGSELVLSSRAAYIERMPQSRVSPLSSNEKTEMLRQWRKFVYSKNPKLLKDIKGQSWIVHLLSGSNTTQNFYYNNPDTITFQWKQVDTTENVVIYGEYNDEEKEIKNSSGDDLWVPLYGKKR